MINCLLHYVENVSVMAKNRSVILLGYPDELVSVEYTSSIDYTVNKIGGKPVRNYTSMTLLFDHSIFSAHCTNLSSYFILFFFCH